MEVDSQEALQLEEFLIIWTVKPRFNRDPIVDLIAKGMWRVVDQDGLGQVATKDIQVFEKVSFNRETGFAKKAVVKVLVF